MKKNKMLFIIPAVVCAIIVVAVLVILLLPKKSEKEILTDSIKQSLGVTKIQELIDDSDYKDFFNDGVFHVNIDGKVKADGEEGKISLDGYVGKEQLYFLLDAAAKNKLNLEALMKDNKLYFNAKDITDKFYYEDLEKEVDLEQFNELAKLTEDVNLDTEKLFELLSDSLENVINSEKIETESETKTINGKDYSTKSYSYDFTGEDLYNGLTSFVKKVKEDKDLNKQLGELLEKFELPYEINDLLDQLTEELKQLTEIKKLFTYKAYVKGNDTISSEFSIVIPEQNIPLKLVVNNVDDYFQVYASVLGQKLLDLVMDKGNEKFSLSVQGTEILTGKISDDYIEIHNSDVIPTDFTIKLTIKEKDKDTFKGNLKLVIDDVDVDFDIVSEKAKDLPKVDVSDAEPYENMPESVKEKFQEIFGTMRNVKDSIEFNDDLSGLGSFA